MNSYSPAREVATLLALVVLSIPAHTQSIPPSVPDWRDGSLSPNQIVDRSQDAKLRPADGATPSKASAGATDLFQRLCPPCGCSSLSPGAAANAATPSSPPLPNIAGGKNLATALGAKIRRIAVEKWTKNGWGTFPAWSDITSEIQHVWSGKMGVVSEHIQWAEGNPWNVWAIIEFEDSDVVGCLVTDGFHVSARDIGGRAWLTRVNK
jgi:hypothetical protein